MKRFLVLLLLVGVGSLPLGCGKSSTPSSPSSGFNFSFLTNFGSYQYNYYQNYNSYCSTYQPMPGEFYDPTGVAIGGGYIFVGDDSWDCIDIFDMNGNWVNFFWPYDSNGNSASYPEGMKISNGKLYVADAYQDEINVYNVSDVVAQVAQTLGCNYVYAQGTYWNSSTGCTPEDVDVDSSGNMYVADYCSGPTGAIYKIAPDYNYSTEPNEGTDVVAYTTSSAAAVTYNGGYLYNPYGIAVDPTGQHVYATDWSNNVIEVYNGGLTATGFIGDSTSAASTVAGKFDGPWGIRLDNQGNLLVVDNGTSLGYPRVQRLTTGGSVLNILGASTTVSGALYSPAYVAEDSNNNVYVSDENIATIDVYSGK